MGAGRQPGRDGGSGGKQVTSSKSRKEHLLPRLLLVAQYKRVVDKCSEHDEEGKFSLCFIA